nr:unnamed protein product [Digitaria exilis]
MLGQQIHERRLVVGLLVGLPLELRVHRLPPPRVLRRGGPHGGPRVHQVERPLAVSDEEDAGVEPHPRPLLVHLPVPPVHHQVVVFVAVEREGEIHVGEDGVGVDPPEPLGVRVGHHGGAEDGDLGPVGDHGGREVRGVVEERDPVEAAVVELVLEEAEEEGSGWDPDTITTRRRTDGAPASRPRVRSHAARLASQANVRGSLPTSAVAAAAEEVVEEKGIVETMFGAGVGERMEVEQRRRSADATAPAANASNSRARPGGTIGGSLCGGRAPPPLAGVAQNADAGGGFGSAVAGRGSGGRGSGGGRVEFVWLAGDGDGDG